MEQPAWRVVILTTIPEVAATLAGSVRRLGHLPVAAVSARRKESIPGHPPLDAASSEPDVDVVVAPTNADVEPMLRSFGPDLVLTWAFPWRLAQGALDVPSLGSVNYHPSLLPRHRGPNPLGWTLRAGDPEYGVTWHRMESGLDTGPILAQRATPVGDEDTMTDVISRLSVLAVRLLPAVFRRLAAGDAGDPQPAAGVTLAPPFGEDYATIDWSMPARAVHDQVRAWAFTAGTRSVPGPLAELDGRTVRITHTTLRESDGRGRRIECGDGPIWVLGCKPAG
jgi:methionyl-tRNA formyltransferase